MGAVLDGLHHEVAADRRFLLRLLRALGVRRRRRLELLGRVGEAVGALKPNERLVRSSPLRVVVELEGLLPGVEGKDALWRSLREPSDTDQSRTRRTRHPRPSRRAVRDLWGK